MLILGPHLDGRAPVKEDHIARNKHHKTKLPNCPQDKRRLVAGLKELVSVKKLITLALRGDTEKLLW